MEGRDASCVLGPAGHCCLTASGLMIRQTGLGLSTHIKESQVRPSSHRQSNFSLVVVKCPWVMERVGASSHHC